MCQNLAQCSKKKSQISDIFLSIKMKVQTWRLQLTFHIAPSEALIGKTRMHESQSHCTKGKRKLIEEAYGTLLKMINQFCQRVSNKTIGQMNRMMMYQRISSTFTRLLYSLQGYEFHPIKWICNFVLLLITQANLTLRNTNM